MDVFPKILISSSHLTPKGRPGAPDAAGSAPALLTLKPGQIVKAVVLESMSSRQARLQISGKSITAQTGIPLDKGETIFLEVSKTGREPVLKLIWNEGGRHHIGTRGAGQDVLGMLTRPEPHKRLSELLNALKSSLQVKTHTIGHAQQKLLARLENTLSQIALKSSSSDNGLIPRLIQYGGLTLENKLGRAAGLGNNAVQTVVNESLELDLKAIALKITDASGGRGSESGQAAIKLVEYLETIQLMNHYASETSGRYLLPIPVFFGDLLKFGQILIEMGKQQGSKKKKEDRLVRVSLLLELSGIGDFLAEILVYKKTVSGTISVGSKEVRQLVERNIPDLVQRLSENGFDIQKFDCRLTSPETLANTSLVDKIIDADEGLLNLIV